MNGFLILGILLVAAMAYLLGYRCGHETTLEDRRELWRLRHQAGIDECEKKRLLKELDSYRKDVDSNDHNP